MKQPNQPWPRAAEAIAEARAALTSAGLDGAAAVESPKALAGPMVALRVEVDAGHFILTLTHWRTSPGMPGWSCGVAAWRPGLETRGRPTGIAPMEMTAHDALAEGLGWLTAQPWAVDAEVAAAMAMLRRLRAVHPEEEGGIA